MMRSKMARLAEINRQLAFFRAQPTEADLIIAANLAIAARMLAWQLDAERSMTPTFLQVQVS